MKRTKLLPLSLLMISANTWAAGNHFYVLGEVSHSKDTLSTSTNDSALIGAGAANLTSNGEGSHNQWRLQFGYQFNPYFAMEAGYIDFGKANYTASYNGGSADGTVKAGGLDIAALGILPLSYGFSVFGKVGVAVARVKSNLIATGTANGATIETTSTSAAPLLGVGVTYKISKNVDLRSEFDHVSNLGKSSSTGKLTANMISIGAVYHF